MGPAGLRYEADPRHQELLSRSLGLTNCRFIGTPGVKWKDDVGSGPVDHEHVQPQNVADTEHEDMCVDATVSSVSEIRRPQPVVREKIVSGNSPVRRSVRDASEILCFHWPFDGHVGRT